ncbi:OstA-like protein [Marinoscillum furvescens]|uniref:Lipopolysaccharide export system protein LptA n=1 Tax=Marinoscillum furvescens DSM 4134 TaxID=1122208 RepID=A0A3D9KZ49_MARFU|nr:OstA-like protein [Marinoscillum furvescens]RED93386.1 lipopolysaccharide export system protein LptA [Marinoscillum furvescens DSM 4134]
MLKILQYYTFLIVLFLLTPDAWGQSNERIKYKADELEYGRKNGENYRKLTGNVIFTQKSTTVYCDTSYFYRKRNVMEASGNVRIVDDSIVITSKKLNYEGDQRMAKLREDVVYREGERELYTDFLDYDLDAEIAHYFNSGKLIDTTNVLTSEVGYYFSLDDYAQFYTDVVLTAPDFTLYTDTLRYNTITKVAYTFGPTKITTEDGTTLHAQGGEFRTVVDESEFIEGNVETEDYYLEGDELFFDEAEKYYKAISNVVLRAKDEDVIITGDEGYYDRRNGISKVYGNPLMKRILEADTFYLAADTLVAIESKYDSAKRILAYHDIKVYKEGLQGIADSMAYFNQDSIIYFYKDPVMWNNSNQITGDTISLEVSEDEIKRMNLRTNSFLISEDSIGNYNQIKGRNMLAFFEDNQIDKIDVNGNGEILYFALEEGDSLLMGMNKIFCATMQIRFQDQKLSSFSVYTEPEAQFIPPHELTPEVQRLDNFSWRSSERPTLYDVAPYLDPDYDPKTAAILKAKGALEDLTEEEDEPKVAPPNPAKSLTPNKGMRPPGAPGLNTNNPNRAINRPSRGLKPDDE